MKRRYSFTMFITVNSALYLRQLYYNYILDFCSISISSWGLLGCDAV
jgi:hypothetical protein